MTDLRVIKKYPNRRLYDTHISRYITLEEIRKLVLQNIAFRVEDKRTHEDITRSILLQVIAEQEEGGDPIFTTELLEFIIRYYGDPMQNSIGRYLELSVELFQQQQQHFSDQLKDLLGQAQQPIHALKELAEKQVPIWRSVRREFLHNLTTTAKSIKRRAGLDEEAISETQKSDS
ncbi:polyhydroxyalkanoate synthesis repressor PhaR [Sinimarinibacterium sp. CAU 1509]|uniref:polyhydroxyalkanoate synthesis repressor PhaR n=1 Tax=Sinimarinibacterium sp. CAU 1509 TaxID=2562283 RepID=UPI0010AD36DB|nr:polyhydroxyalkanoate synthesis repressor PhaR [Sinimarinibacterium sp. CAU 1509]TJY62180.1 polyhydroxyalkanoate synthesis repressor PhaR [Sinimarinibacterium sp. CAU 1509]